MTPPRTSPTPARPAAVPRLGFMLALLTVVVTALMALGLHYPWWTSLFAGLVAAANLHHPLARALTPPPV